MGDRFSFSSREIISRAVFLASELGHIYVGTEHLLLALTEAGTVRDTDFDTLRNHIKELCEGDTRTYLTEEDMTPAMHRILDGAGYSESGQIQPEHILICLLSTDCVATRILEDMEKDTEKLKSTAKKQATKKYGPKKDRVPTPTLDRYAVSLTEKAEVGEIDPVIGREKEEERVMRILLRRRKNNPLLIGEAGVGKTAVAEAIACRIIRGDVPSEMRTRRILSLDMATVVAGTKYRGEFEEKLRAIIREATEDRDVILFVDEIHTLVGAGSAEGAVDASNILKPALARGEIQLMGATTPKEYRKSIEKDGALSRRFQTVLLEEPTVEQCKQVLYALKDRYEEYHGIKLTPAAIDVCAEYSDRYLGGRYLPDKAIDLMDEAASAQKMRGGKTVTKEDIAALVGEISGVNAEFVLGGNKAVLQNAEQLLEKELAGQRDASEKILSFLERRSYGQAEGALLFYGQAGVGKALCASLLARAFSAKKDTLVTVDLSEYTSPASLSKLIGTPDYYGGKGEGGKLTEKIKKYPFSVILFDKAERAHPDVISFIGGILDTGVCEDCDGNKISFKDCLIIICCTKEGNKAGFLKSDGADVKAALPLLYEKAETVEFSPLDSTALRQIAAKRLGNKASALTDTQINACLKESGGSAGLLLRAVNRLSLNENCKKVREYQKST